MWYGDDKFCQSQHPLTELGCPVGDNFSEVHGLGCALLVKEPEKSGGTISRIGQLPWCRDADDAIRVVKCTTEQGQVRIVPISVVLVHVNPFSTQVVMC